MDYQMVVMMDATALAFPRSMLKFKVYLSLLTFGNQEDKLPHSNSNYINNTVFSAHKETSLQ